MFAAIGVCCAVRAASFTWGSGNTVNALNTAEEGYASASTTYYLFAVGSESSAISSFDKEALQITVGGTKYSAVDSHRLTSSESLAGAFSDSYTASESTINQNYYVVLFDADTAGSAGSALITVSGVTEMTTADYKAQIDASGIGTASNMTIPVTSGGGGSSDVPEPTSGLLLVIGGAMLALRRRK